MKIELNTNALAEEIAQMIGMAGACKSFNQYSMPVAHDRNYRIVGETNDLRITKQFKRCK